METTEALDLQATTMAGDIRDMILTHIRSMETPWSKLSENQQRDKIDAAASAGRDLTRKAVSLVAHRGFAHMPITLKDWTVKDGIQLKVTALDTVEEITKLAEHRSGSALIVFASTSAFLGARTEVEPDPDQPSLDVELAQQRADRLAGMSIEESTIEAAERMVASAAPGVLKGMTVRLDHFEPSERRDALQALALSKGASVILDGGEVVEPEKAKRGRKSKEQRVAERAAAVGGNPVTETAMPAEPSRELADA